MRHAAVRCIGDKAAQSDLQKAMPGG